MGNQKTNGTTWLVAGSLLGAGIALLLAPQSGRKTRRDILNHLVEGISETVEDGIERGREWTDKTTQGVLQALNTGKQYVQKEIEKVMHVRA